MSTWLNLPKEELLKRVGHFSQLAGIEDYQVTGGPGKGTRVLQVKTGTGFQFSVVPDRGLDIYQAEFQGLSLAWHSCNQLLNPSFYESAGLGWLRSFFGGLLTTCGLTYAGAPEPGEGLHGRANNLPAREVTLIQPWTQDDFRMEIKGVMEEVSVFGPKLRLTRTIKTKLGENKLFIQDKVENIGFEKSPLMIIYHFNLGYPLLDEGAKIVVNETSIIPRDEEAAKGLAEAKKISAPQPGFKEQVFYFDLPANETGWAEVRLVNEKQKLQFYLRYEKKNLPRFIEWKMMGTGEYVLGLEPANCYPEGRSKEKERGTLVEIAPGEVIAFNLEVGVLG